MANKRDRNSFDGEEEMGKRGGCERQEGDQITNVNKNNCSY